MEMIEASARIRQRIPAEAAAKAMGIRFRGDGMAICPFHKSGGKAEMKFYDNKGWHCSGCGAGGSVIDLVMRLRMLTFSQAVVWLDNEYALGLDEENRWHPEKLHPEKENETLLYLLDQLQQNIEQETEIKRKREDLTVWIEKLKKKQEKEWKPELETGPERA